MSKPFTLWVCALSLVGGTFSVVLPDRALCADVNADGRVDVLDIQHVISGVVSACPGQSSDVNGDGRVDILDFQLAVVLSGGPTDQTPSSPQSEDHSGCFLAHSRVDWANPAFHLVPGMLEAQQKSFRPADAFCTIPHISSSERYLYQLTPHAPPLAA